jgi:peptide-methionine (S)-S-oxide reductase
MTRLTTPLRSALHAISVILVAATALADAATAGTTTPATSPHTASAMFAGGCFWSMEKSFEDVPGVLTAVSGYSGGTVANPSYEEVCSGTTGHYETVRVEYDPAKITYDQLLDIYWHNTDPTDPTGQFCDHGKQYQPVVFVADVTQRRAAEASKLALDGSHVLKKPVVTRILPAGPFYPAEDYHQDFFKREPERYEAYRMGCGRDRVMTALWGKDAHKGSVHK